MKRAIAIALALCCLNARLLDDTTPDYFRVDQVVASSAPFTVCIWFNSDDSTINQLVVDIGDISDANHHWRMSAIGLAGDKALSWRVRAGGAPQQVASTSPSGYTAGTWNHGCAVEAGAADRTIYIDSNSGTNTTSRTPAGADRTTFGFRSAGTADPFSGKLAQAAIWTVALTDSEIATLSAGFSPLRVRRDALAFFAPLNGGQSPEPDIIGNLDLTITGSPTKTGEPPIHGAIIAP